MLILPIQQEIKWLEAISSARTARRRMTTPRAVP